MERALGEAYTTKAHRRSAGASDALAPDSPDRHRAFRDWHHQPAAEEFDEAEFLLSAALRYPGEARTSAQIHKQSGGARNAARVAGRCGEGFQESVALDPVPLAIA